MRFQYAGPGPHEIPDGDGGSVILRPGDIFELDEEPSFGPWELLDGPDSEPAGVDQNPTQVHVELPNTATNFIQPSWPGVTPPVTPEGNK